MNLSYNSRNRNSCFLGVLILLQDLLFLSSCGSHSALMGVEEPIIEEHVDYATNRFRNPIIRTSLPDPSIIEAEDGFFYLYATEDIRNTPIYKSKDLVSWRYDGTAFTEKTRPTILDNGGIWAPDINYINGKYVLYYSQSTWGGEWACGIGVAVSDSPEGPFTDLGKLFTSKEIGVQNCIDPFYIEDDGIKYLFFGSLRGIYAVELSEDGYSIKEGITLQPIKTSNGIEGTYIYKKDGYYYMFASAGSCCSGLNSTYKLVCGRSDSLLGPYKSPSGGNVSSNVILKGNSTFVGPGHNAEIIIDDNGQDWILYHGYMVDDPHGRYVFLDKIDWVDGWPVINDGFPSEESDLPYFK